MKWGGGARQEIYVFFQVHQEDRKRDRETDSLEGKEYREYSCHIKCQPFCSLSRTCVAPMNMCWQLGQTYKLTHSSLVAAELMVKW